MHDNEEEVNTKFPKFGNCTPEFREFSRKKGENSRFCVVVAGEDVA